MQIKLTARSELICLSEFKELSLHSALKSQRRSGFETPHISPLRSVRTPGFHGQR